jgi:hypothetical protein
MARADELGALLLQAVASTESHRRHLGTSRNIWTPDKAVSTSCVGWSSRGPNQPNSTERPQRPRRMSPPLSRSNQTRLLRSLQARAEAGDVASAEAILRLGMLARSLPPRSPAPECNAGGPNDPSRSFGLDVPRKGRPALGTQNRLSGH